MNDDHAVPSATSTAGSLVWDSRLFRRWKWLPGVLVTCTIMGLLVTLRAVGFAAPNPGSCLLIGVAFAAAMGRVRAGLTSAAISILFSLYYFSTPGHPFTYTGHLAAHVLVSSVLLVVMALMVGLLKLRNDKLTLERVQRVDQLKVERNRADANLRRFAELESIIEGTPAGVFIGTPEGITLCNKIGLKMVGVDTIGEMLEIFPNIFDRLQATWTDTGEPIKPEERPFTRAFRGETIHRDMKIVRISDGHEMITTCAVAPIIADDRIVAGVAVFTDITERIRIEESLRRSEASYRRLIETATEGIWIVNPAGETTFCNERMAAMVELTPAEMLGRPLTDFVEKDAVCLESVSPDRPAGHHDAKLIGVNGREIWALVSTNPIFDDDGAYIGVLGMVTDITDRKHAEAKIEAVYQREHRIAETLQRSLLLNRTDMRFPGYYVDAFYQPALEEALVGGDFFDAFPLDGGLVAFAVGDVSGKGLEAAAHTAEVKYTLRALLREYPSPSMALSRVNEVLCDRQRIESTSFDGFICLAVVVADTRTGQLDISIAGAEPPVIVRSNADVEVMVPDGGLPLGVLPMQEYETHVFHMALGDVLMITTDGLTEARKAPGQFGLEGICLAAVEAHGTDTLAEYAKKIVDAATNFAGGALHDDVCLLMVERLKPQQYLPDRATGG